MPFTLVHPVAVLPLARGPLTLLALACGSIAPDLPYFLRATPLPVTAESWYGPLVNATTSHSLAGLLPVSLPLALAAYLCVSAALPPARWATGLLPRTPAPSVVAGRLRRGGWIVVSLLVGALTHLAWDGLTEIGASGGRLLQHGSTALGAAVLAVVLWRRRPVLDRGDTTGRRRRLTVAAGFSLTAVAGAAFAGWAWSEPESRLSTGEFVEGLVTAAVKGAGVGLAGTAAVLVLAWWIWHLLGGARGQDVALRSHVSDDERRETG